MNWQTRRHLTPRISGAGFAGVRLHALVMWAKVHLESYISWA